MARQYEGKVTVVSMGGRASVGDMRAFVERHDLGFLPTVADPDGQVWGKLGVRGQPAWIFIDAGGKTTTNFGELKPDEVRSRFDTLLAQ